MCFNVASTCFGLYRSVPRLDVGSYFDISCSYHFHSWSSPAEYTRPILPGERRTRRHSDMNLRRSENKNMENEHKTRSKDFCGNGRLSASATRTSALRKPNF